MVSKTPGDAKVAILNYIDERLRQWAEWFMKDSPKGVGYPPHSLEYRLWREGLYIRGYQGSKPSPTNDAAEEIETLIKELYIQNFQLAEVVRVNYLHRGRKEDKARCVGISPTQFVSELSAARWWLAARLTTQKQLRPLMHHFRRISSI